MRIAIIEDHLMFRDIIRRVCVDELGYEIVAETESGLAGVTIVAKLRPDLLVLDLCIPELDGFSVIERVKRIAPKTKILVVSGHLDDFTVLQIERAGVSGFIDKNTNQVAVLKNGLRSIVAGKVYFSPTFEAIRRDRRKDPNWFAKLLSRTELKVLSLVGRGLNNGEIGSHLGISARTAQKHRTRLLQKLRLRGTPKLMMFALQHGFTPRTTSSLRQADDLHGK